MPDQIAPESHLHPRQRFTVTGRDINRVGIFGVDGGGVLLQRLALVREDLFSGVAVPSDQCSDGLADESLPHKLLAEEFDLAPDLEVPQPKLVTALTPIQMLRVFSAIKHRGPSPCQPGDRTIGRLWIDA